MGLIPLFFSDPRLFLILVFFLPYSVILHEIAHGWVAYLFGDTTAKLSGRLSFNPKSHIDPLGAFMLFLVGFGWARPVPVNLYNLRNFRWGVLAVSLAGPFTNILIATLALFFLQLPFLKESPFFATNLFILAKININLGAFNLIPIPPLDGSRLFLVFGGEKALYKLARLEPFTLILLLVLLGLGFLEPIIDFFIAAVLFLVVSLIGFFS